MIDNDRRTLHIRCGSDIRDKLKCAGFTGDFLEYADPICEGPVPDVPDLIAVRSRYLADNFGWFKGQPQTQIAADLRDSETGLAAAHQYGRVVLWFEHDSHDQLVLARAFARFRETTVPACLQLICIDRHPDVPRFVGLGQLEPPALAALWPTRQPITPRQVALGGTIWAALRQPDPTSLYAVAQTGTPALPIATPALWRHLRELPDATGGLSLTQRLVLTVLANGPNQVGRIFAASQQEIEPLPFLDDTGFLRVVTRMALTEPAVLVIHAGERPFSREASITETGRRVLAGQVDYLTLNPPGRWVGGHRVDGTWRWDDRAGRLVHIA
jgi:hypothetical protein